MTTEIISEIEKYLEQNNNKTQIISDIIQHLDINSQYEVLDSILFLHKEKNIEVQEAINLVFNNILAQMGYRFNDE